MANIIVVGAQWGDEGKGKVVDFLSERFDVVARYQGGNNAGHTVVIGGRQDRPPPDPLGRLAERQDLCPGQRGGDRPGRTDPGDGSQLERLHVKFEDHFFISRRAHLVLPYHKLLDVAHEQRAAKKIGTTGRGIGPAYVDKMARVGIRVGDLHQPALFKERLSQKLAEKRAQFPESRALAALEPDRMFHDHLKHYERIQNHLADASLVLDRLMREGKQVLFEGAQGTLLDVDLGTYPYVTSSSATAGGACTGTGVSPKRIHGILGICKAYTTRVGEGPFPTELADEIGDQIRERGAEFGATTGRPRRTGWFDAVGVRYAVRVNGLDALALMKLDVLDGLETLRACTAYRYRGELLTEFPNETDILAECEPVYGPCPAGRKTPSASSTRRSSRPTARRTSAASKRWRAFPWASSPPVRAATKPSCGRTPSGNRGDWRDPVTGDQCASGPGPVSCSPVGHWSFVIGHSRARRYNASAVDRQVFVRNASNMTR